jgi:glutamyl-tRNA reductase
LQPALIVIGVDFRTGSALVQEKFRIRDAGQQEALSSLALAEGIDEVLLIATCRRTEFLLWSNDPTLAADSVLRFLCAKYALQFCEWKYFYRLLDEMALAHIFQVTAGTDTLIGEPKGPVQLRDALEQAKRAGTTGRFLDAVVEKALGVARKLQSRGRASPAELDKFADAEAREFIHQLLNEKTIAAAAALRERLDQVCRQELDSFRQERGPFPKDVEQKLDAVTSRISRRMAGLLAHELKEPPENAKQELVSDFLDRLLRLETPQRELAGTK